MGNVVKSISSISTMVFYILICFIIWEFHTVYFDHIHPSPSSFQIFYPYPSLCSLSLSLSFNSSNPVRIAQLLRWGGLLWSILGCSRCHTIKENHLSFSHQLSNAGGGTLCLPPSSMLGLCLIWVCKRSCAGCHSLCLPCGAQKTLFLLSHPHL